MLSFQCSPIPDQGSAELAPHPLWETTMNFSVASFLELHVLLSIFSHSCQLLQCREYSFVRTATHSPPTFLTPSGASRILPSATPCTVLDPDPPYLYGLNKNIFLHHSSCRQFMHFAITYAHLKWGIVTHHHSNINLAFQLFRMWSVMQC